MPTKSASKIITRDQRWLGPLIHPGEMLLEECLKPLGVGQVEAARELGVSLNRLNEIVLGKRGITADTALRLARFLKTSPQLWMRLQADAVAAVFHDLGIWTNGTFDYLAPSIALARDYLVASAREDWTDEIEEMIVTTTRSRRRRSIRIRSSRRSGEQTGSTSHSD